MPRSCGMESKMQYAGNPRDVATEPVSLRDDDDCVYAILVVVCSVWIVFMCGLC